MTFFTGAIGLLVVAVIGVFLLPKLWAGRQAGETTLDWLALRDAELSREEPLLEQGVSSLRSDAELRVFDELQEGQGEGRRGAGSSLQNSLAGRAIFGCRDANVAARSLLFPRQL